VIERIRGRLANAGFGLCAPLSVETYDRLVPAPWRVEAVFAETRGILVVANAGRSLWPRFRASREAALERDPLDHYTARVFGEACAPDAHFALYHEQRSGAYLPLVALAERAGLGTPGRVGVLLHPEYGPWLSLRGLVYLPHAVPGSEPEPFAPCSDCPAPCASACHAGVVGTDGLDAGGCYRARLELEPCKLRCDARAACVLGPEHAFLPEQVAHHSLIRLPGPTPRTRR
jgi:hypothetical protein